MSLSHKPGAVDGTQLLTSGDLGSKAPGIKNFDAHCQQQVEEILELVKRQPHLKGQLDAFFVGLQILLDEFSNFQAAESREFAPTYTGTILRYLNPHHRNYDLLAEVVIQAFKDHSPQAQEGDGGSQYEEKKATLYDSLINTGESLFCGATVVPIQSIPEDLEGSNGVPTLIFSKRIQAPDVAPIAPIPPFQNVAADTSPDLSFDEILGTGPDVEPPQPLGSADIGLGSVFPSLVEVQPPSRPRQSSPFVLRATMAALLIAVAAVPSDSNPTVPSRAPVEQQASVDSPQTLKIRVVPSNGDKALDVKATSTLIFANGSPRGGILKKVIHGSDTATLTIIYQGKTYTGVLKKGEDNLIVQR